jgi:hypothetical protein
VLEKTNGAEHEEQTVAPVVLEKVGGVQPMQEAEAVADWYLPGSQAEQAVAPQKGACCPAAQA